MRSDPASHQPSATEIRAYPNGPLLVRGPLLLLDEDQNEVCTGREVVALCRCGRSKLAPLCDGSHRGPKKPRVPEG